MIVSIICLGLSFGALKIFVCFIFPVILKSGFVFVIAGVVVLLIAKCIR